MSKFGKFVTSMLHARKLEKLHDLELDEYLKAYLKEVDRAEAPVDPKLRKDHEYRTLLQSTHGKWMEDGVYICACGGEIPLYHFEGKHPLRRLQCGACKHVYSDKDCLSTEILTPIKRQNIPTSGLYKELVQGMGQICSTCGLTHSVALRGDSSAPNFEVKCPCGSRSRPDWVVFFILSPEPYRYDPNVACVKLKQKWAAQRTEKTLAGMLRDVRKAPAKSTRLMRSTVSTVQVTPLRQAAPVEQDHTVQRPLTDAVQSHLSRSTTVTQPAAVDDTAPTTNGKCTLKRSPAVHRRRTHV